MVRKINFVTYKYLVVKLFTCWLTEKYMPGFNPNTDIQNLYLDGLFLVFILVCIGLFVLATMFCLYDPREAIFVGQLISEKYYSYVPIGLLTVIPQVYVLLVIELSIVLAGGGGMTYLYYLIMFIINEFRLNSKKHYRANSTFRSLHNIVYLYRSVQVLQEQALCFMGPFITLLHLLMCVLPVLCNYVLFLYWGKLQWLVKAFLLLGYLYSVIFWMFILQIGKYLWVRGNKNFDSWSKVGFSVGKIESKEMRKFQNSCRLILLRHGKVLVLGRMTQFVYVKIVMIYTCKALLTLRK